MSLFSQQENDEFNAHLESFEKRVRNEKGVVHPDWRSIYAEREQFCLTKKIALVRRAQERRDEYLHALLVIVGSRGVEYIEFTDAFSFSDSERMQSLLAQYDTPWSRRDLYTLLRAIAEIPMTWGMSAFARFLRGNGKQKGAEYHGAGRFSSDYGWKASEVDAVCRVLMAVYEDNPYSTVILKFIENEAAIEGRHFGAGCYEKDLPFIDALCKELEQRGLAAIVPPKAPVFKKEREKKVFVAGDVILKKDLRDLPLPAHVRIPVETRRDKSDAWVPTTVDLVVFKFGPGLLLAARCVDASQNTSCGATYTGKEDLEGAIFLRVWDGTHDSTKTCKRSVEDYRNAANKELILVFRRFEQ